MEHFYEFFKVTFIFFYRVWLHTLTLNSFDLKMKRTILKNEYYKSYKEDGFEDVIFGRKVVDYKYQMIISPDLPLKLNVNDLLGLASNSDGFENCTVAELYDTVSAKSSCSSYQKEVENFASTSDIEYSDGLKDVLKTRLSIDSEYVNMDSNYTVAGE